MDLDLRKTAADAAYIAVGAGVLGFQQAQVRRREAGDRLMTIAKDTQVLLGSQTDALRTRVADTATTGIDSATSTLKTLDPRQWVEPVIEQLKGISVTAPMQALPEQLTKAVEVGKARVQTLRGQTAS